MGDNRSLGQDSLYNSALASILSSEIDSKGSNLYLGIGSENVPEILEGKINGGRCKRLKTRHTQRVSSGARSP